MHGRVKTLVLAVAAVVLALPALVFRYLPMTDLPQHEAVLSILLHLDDPGFGFGPFYERHLTASPYLFPYGIAAFFTLFMPVSDAFHVLAFLSVLALPLGMLAVALAQRRQVWPVLFAFVFAYDRAFFWGFINLKLGIGAGLVAIAAALVEPESRTSKVVAQMATLVAAFTHPYGLALPLAFVVIHAVLGGGWRVLRPSVLLPGLACTALWAITGSQAMAYDEPISPSLSERILTFHAQVLGGYQDATEAALLVAVSVGIAIAILARGKERLWQDPRDRAFACLFAINLLLYLTLPQATATAKFVHFRHAALAMVMTLPLAMPDSSRARDLGPVLAVSIAIFATVNAWVHLAAFDAEARSFDAVRGRIPDASKVVMLAYDPHGEVMRTAPYLHFAAHVQAEKGGLLAITFPRLFWNLPVRFREDALVPRTPVRFEWHPGDYDYLTFGYFYDFVLVRRPGPAVLATSDRFPYRPVLVRPPWQLYERAP